MQEECEEAGCGLSCTCSSVEFDRVVVSRPDGADYATEFVACSVCAVMYWAPAVAAAVGGVVAEGLSDSHAALMKDVRLAAKDYRKPGRQPKRRQR